MLKQQIEALGIVDSARIQAPTTHIFEEYAASALLAMSSHYEGFPMVMIEAMGCGLPVVTFDYPCGPRDIIRNGGNGVIVPEGDCPALANALEALMRDDARRGQMGQEARKVTKTYSEEIVMVQWTKCFQKLLA